MRKTKIVATMGPSTLKLELLVNMIKDGMDICRLNFSHGSQSSHATSVRIIREASKLAKKEVAILCDLQGQKIRVDKLENPIELKENETYHIGVNNLSNYENFIPTTYKDLVKDAKTGDRILMDDGLMEAKVIDKNSEVIKIKIITGGTLKSNKGINLPDTHVSAPTLSEKDLKDIEFINTLDVDFIALSFVRTKRCVLEVKEKTSLPIISKIEKPEAIKNIDEIIAVSDGIMIARGDLAVEVGAHKIPALQKEIIKKCNIKNKPVITATQMLESMTTNSYPLRSEASDIANSTLDGSDALMLSGETANGKDPLRVIQTMASIIEETESINLKRKNIPKDYGVHGALQLSAMNLAEEIKAKAIVVITEAGYSPRILSGFKPKNDVLAYTADKQVARRLLIHRGVSSFYIKDLYKRDGEDKVFDSLREQKIEGLIVLTKANRDMKMEENTIRVEVVK